MTGFAARVICNLKGPACGTPLQQPPGGTPNYFQAITAELATRSDCSFGSYDAKLHGVGALRF